MKHLILLTTVLVMTSCVKKVSGTFDAKENLQFNGKNGQVAVNMGVHAAQLKLKDIGYRVSVSSLRADHVRTVRPILLLLQGGALSLLLIGGVNLINLLLIRASVRAREFAVRKALGAARRDVVREVFVETVLLGAFGGTLGLCVSVFGINLLSILGTEELPLGAQVTFDGRVAAVAW